MSNQQPQELDKGELVSATVDEAYLYDLATRGEWNLFVKEYREAITQHDIALLESVRAAGPPDAVAGDKTYSRTLGWVVETPDEIHTWTACNSDWNYAIDTKIKSLKETV